MFIKILFNFFILFNISLFSSDKKKDTISFYCCCCSKGLTEDRDSATGRYLLSFMQSLGINTDDDYHFGERAIESLIKNSSNKNQLKK
jgi:hypothetical protein